MSDVNDDPQLQSESAVGTTSQDAMVNDRTEDQPQGLLASMSLYDSMLVLAFLFIAAATVRLFFVLRQYSEGFPLDGAYPWSTAEYQWLMWF